MESCVYLDAFFPDPISLQLACPSASSFFFFFNDPATPEIYTLPLHDALPILPLRRVAVAPDGDVALPALDRAGVYALDPPVPPLDQIAVNLLDYNESNIIPVDQPPGGVGEDRKSTRLNSSHLVISYAVFCLKK